jgi:ribosomal 50S subunit-recycling heat shock protein
MRIDKYLKVTRLIKRRELAKEMLDKGYISLNGKLAKPASEVNSGDEITISLPNGRTIKALVKEIRAISTIKDADSMYELLSDEKKESNII